MLKRPFAFSVAILLFVQIVGRAETWSERLGYPAGRRVVILSAREMGLAWEISECGKQLIESGKVQSIDVLATGPWFHDFADWARKNTDYDIGLNVALTNPHDNPRWRFVSGRSHVPSLVDADGFPWRTPIQLASTATAQEVDMEIHSQIIKARMAGIQLTHLSSYYGTAFTRADLTAVYLNASKKFWLPAPVVELTPEHIARFRQEGFPISDEIVQMIREYPLPKLDDIQLMPPGDSYEEKRNRFCELLTILPPGLTQIIMRPAIESPGLRQMGTDWQERVWDFKLLGDEHVMKVMEEQRILVTNWRDIMRRFESGTEPPAAPKESEPQGE